MTDQLVYIDGELYHADDFTDEELAHYGVKGMKWGRRKLKQKNNEAFNRYSESANQTTRAYSNQVNDLRAKYKSGQIDRATFDAGKAEAFRSFKDARVKQHAAYASEVSRNKKQRREAIRNNARNALDEIEDYSSTPGKAYRRFLSNDVNLARANGLSRGQAVRNAYTQFYTNQRLYDR